MSGDILGHNRLISSVSKSNRLHTEIFLLLLKEIGVYSIDSSKMMGNFPEVLNFNQLNLKLDWFICN